MAEIIGKIIIELPVVDSTNNYAMSNAGKFNYDEGTVIVAKSQLSGRGQRNNTWESELGSNLLMSIVLKPIFLPVQYQFILSKVAALAVSDTVALFVENVMVKWPNDIYVEDKKIAGILIDNSIMGSTFGLSVAGIGLNINQVEFSTTLPNPTSLAVLMKRKLDIGEITQQLIESYDFWYKTLLKGETHTIDTSYMSRLYMAGIERQYRDQNGEYYGKIAGVDEIGRLIIIDREGCSRKYHFKEVEMLPIR